MAETDGAPDEFFVDDVPFIGQDQEHMCVPASISMVVDYLIGRPFPVSDITEMCKTKFGNGTPWNPERLKASLEKAIPGISIEQKENSNIAELKNLVSMKIIPIVHFNGGLLFSGTRITSGHAAPIIGYTVENLRANDPMWRSDMNYAIRQFSDAWKAEKYRVTIIKRVDIK